MPGSHLDGDGLILRVTEKGSRSWILRTVVKRKRCDMGLGSRPMVSLKEAREKAARFRKIAREGGDPFAARTKESRTVPTFQDAAERAHKKATWNNRKHKA